MAFENTDRCIDCLLRYSFFACLLHSQSMAILTGTKNSLWACDFDVHHHTFFTRFVIKTNLGEIGVFQY